MNEIFIHYIKNGFRPINLNTDAENLESLSKAIQELEESYRSKIDLRVTIAKVDELRHIFDKRIRELISKSKSESPENLSQQYREKYEKDVADQMEENLKLKKAISDHEETIKDNDEIIKEKDEINAKLEEELSKTKVELKIRR